MHFGHALHSTHHINTTKLEHVDCDVEDRPEVCHWFQDHDADGSGALSVDEAVDGIMTDIEPPLHDFVAAHGGEDRELSYHEFHNALLEYEEEHHDAE